MSRFFSASILVVAAMALCATGSLANIPDPELSEVPDMMTLSTTTPTQGLATFDFVVVVEGQGGPVANSLVEVEFAPSAEDLIAWWADSSSPERYHRSQWRSPLRHLRWRMHRSR